MDFTSSSHRNKWILSEESLSSLRQAANKKGVDYIIHLRNRCQLPTDGFTPLTAEEEHKYVLMYTQVLANQWRQVFPPKVVATAVTFVKRFFLYHSCMEHEVMKILFACLYIAGKVCEHYIDAKSLAEAFPKTVKAADVLQQEPLVLAGLQFDLMVYQPYHYVAAMIEELGASLDAQERDLLTLQTTWNPQQQQQQEPQQNPSNRNPEDHAPQDRHVLTLTASYARMYLDSMMHSDAVLLMSPQQQALCAVCEGLKRHGMPEDVCVRRYSARVSDDAAVQAEAAAALQEVLLRGASFAEEGAHAPEPVELNRLFAQLQHINPLLDKNSQVIKDLKTENSKRKRDATA